MQTKFAGDYIAFRRALEKMKDEKMAHYLLKHVFNSKVCNTKENIANNMGFDINHSMYTTIAYDTVTQTPLQVAIHHGNNAMAKAIIRYNLMDIDVFSSGIIAYALKNDFNSVAWMMEEAPITSLIMQNDLILKKDKNYSNVIIHGRFDKDRRENSILDVFAWHGDALTFSSMILKIFEFYNVKSFKDCDKISSILNDESFEYWIKRSQRQTVMLSFLTRLYEIAFKNKNFGLFVSILEKNCQDGTKVTANEEVTSLSNQFRKDFKTAQYLFEKLSNNSKMLKELSIVINEGLMKQECGFNDSFLFLSKLIDSDAFTKCLENVTDECLSSEKKTVQKYQFFKNNLLHSNVWAMSRTEDKDDAVKSEINAIEEKIDEQLLLFDSIKSGVVDKELKSQQMYIQNCILSEESNNLLAWKKLVSNGVENYEAKPSKDTNISIQAKYQVKDLPSDTVTGFDGAKEYDHNGFLTDLLIASNTIDPLFQRDCKNIFDKFTKEFGIKCQYSPAPPKTKERAITKAELDYKDRPCMSHVFRFVVSRIYISRTNNIMALYCGFLYWLYK